MNSLFIPDDVIEELMKICEAHLSPSKRQLKIYQKEFPDCHFSHDRPNNCEELSNMVKAFLWKTNKKYRKEITECMCDRMITNPKDGNPFPTGVSGHDFMQTYIWKYLREEMNEPWNFFLNVFYYQRFYDENIERIVRNYGIVPENLFYVDDYKKYWNQFSEKNVEPRLINTTNQIVDGLSEIYVNILILMVSFF